jgi:hypothetical protein
MIPPSAPDPDPDLRARFQRWRAREADAAPPFPHLPAGARPPARPLLRPWLRWTAPLGAAAALAVVAAAVVWIRLAPAPSPTGPGTLAAALPRPLLPDTPAGPVDFLSAATSVPGISSGSDFLLPPSARTAPSPSLF